jgi:ADP-heptose:LPS heptosyltransferase
MKFLILRFSSIGDIVLTTPVIRCLKKKYPDAEIHYATKRAFKTILQNNPYLTKIHVLDDSASSLINELKAEKFDFVIDLHHNQRTLFIKTRLGARSASFNKINFEKWLMVNFKINRLPKQHIVDRYLAACTSLGVINDGEGLDYFIAGEDEVDIKTLPESFAGGYVGWVIGAKHNTKKFPWQKIASALDKVNLPVVLLGGKEDAEAAAHIIAQTSHTGVYNACGKYNLNQSASLVKQAMLIVTNDTGLMHISAAFKKPVISIWGNTIPAFGMGPYHGANHWPDIDKGDTLQQFEVLNLSCRPCSKLGYPTCPKGHFKCMNDIDELEIAQRINHLGQ